MSEKFGCQTTPDRLNDPAQDRWLVNGIVVSPAGAHQLFNIRYLVCLTIPKIPTAFCGVPRNLANAEAPDRPPDKQRKTAGRAVTLRSGAFFSCAAIFTVYRIMESAASAKSAGGAK
jgi:hypothetical protein